MKITEFLRPERICILEDRKKSEVLIHLCELAESTGDEIPDLEELKKEIFFREELMSTGIGLGLAVPHVRLEGLKDTVLCIGVQSKGIYDYDAMDGKAVTLVLMILVAKDQHRKYIRILSQLTGLLKQGNLIERLSNASSPEEIFSILTEQ